jgi:hypothetical protein
MQSEPRRHPRLELLRPSRVQGAQLTFSVHYRRQRYVRVRVAPIRGATGVPGGVRVSRVI